MALTNQIIGVGGIAGGGWTLEDLDTAAIGRMVMLGLLVEGAAGVNGFTQARAGCLAGPSDTASQIPNCFAQLPTGSGLNLQIRRGAAVVERDIKVGPYIVAVQATGTVTLATADSTNTRVDRVDLQVLDGTLGDNGGAIKVQYVVTSGTGTPVGGVIPVAAAPANSIPICQVNLTANAPTVTGGMIVDKRRSTALRGTRRVLLPGDTLSDPGINSGEERDTSAILVANGGGTVDRWNSATSAWETLFPLPGLYEADFASSSSLLTNARRAMGWGTVNTPTPAISLSAGGPGTAGSGVVTFNRGGLWQINVSVDCPLPSSTASVVAMSMNDPADTGADFILGSRSHTVTSDGGAVRIAAGKSYSVVVNQQTGSTQTVTGRFRATLLRG